MTRFKKMKPKIRRMKMLRVVNSKRFGQFTKVETLKKKMVNRPKKIHQLRISMKMPQKKRKKSSLPNRRKIQMKKRKSLGNYQLQMTKSQIFPMHPNFLNRDLWQE